MRITIRTTLLLALIILLVECSDDKVQSDRTDEDFIPTGPVFSPLFLGEAPANAGTSLLEFPDGTISFFYRSGDWDSGGFSKAIYSISTADEGRTWNAPIALVDTGENSAQNFMTISPATGELLVFYRKRGSSSPKTWLARSGLSRTDWSNMKIFSDENLTAVGYGHSIWIEGPGGVRRVLCGFHQPDQKGPGTYYSDDDGLTWSRSNKVYVPNLIPNIWQTGGVEPALIELKDGRIWMLIRSSNDHLWEAFSTDRGASWGEARPTRFQCGPNTWISPKRLSDGRILLVWNNAMHPDPMATQDKWSFLNREVIHAAISHNEGRTWHGFREVLLDRMRNSGEFCNHPGDKGLNESKLAETAEGHVLIACGQAPGHRAFLLLDPDWLYETESGDDFSEGLKYWATHKILVRPPIYSRRYHHNYNRTDGAVLIDHPEIAEKKVLHVRRIQDPTVFSQRDGAVWNFPAGFEGTFETRIHLNKGFRGGIIALNDRYFLPTDNRGEETAMFLLKIPGQGVLDPATTLEKNTWYTVTFKWKDVRNPELSQCEVAVDGVPLTDKLILRHPSLNGLSYVRFRSTTMRESDEGFYVEYVKVRISPAQ